MLFYSGGRITLRIAIALLIPTGIVLWLLYAAAAEEENIHDRNLRWLAQMATQIHDRVQNYTNFVHDRAAASRSDVATVQPAADAQPYSIENLVPPPGSARCDPREWRHLSVVDEGRDRYLRFVQVNGKHRECAQSDLKKLVESALRKDVFTSVLLAQRNGRVLYQSGPESLRITDVSFLFDNPYNAPTASIHITRPIGDTKFEVFLQPLPILMHAESAPSDTDWLLIGLSEKRNLLRACSPRDVMLFLPFILLLVGLSWPLQRFWTLGPTEQVRTKDVVLIVFCSLGCVVVTSLLFIAEYSRQLSKARADEQLRSFAESIGSHFKTELQLAIRQLQHLDEIASKEGAGPQTSVFERSLNWKDVYLAFEYADWINSEGEKTIRWTPKSTPPQRVKVFDRGYFQDIKSGAALFLPEISTERFSIEHVLSRTSGQAATMIAIASKEKHSDVASIALNLVSLSDPVAPKDLGFAVIDMDGKVLFHSEPSRMFVENLFEECRRSGELSGIVSRRIRAFVNVDYAASPYRMLVTPIPEAERLPWTLVIFRKLPPNRIARMQILVDTSVLLCVYGASLVLLLTLAFRLLPRTALLFPRVSSPQWWGASQAGYSYVAGVGMLLLLIVWRAFDRLHDSELFYAALASGFVFILITAIGLRVPGAGRRLRTWRTRRLFRRKLVLRLLGVPLVIAALSLFLHDWWMAVVAPAATVSCGLWITRGFDAVRREHHRPMLRASWLVWGVQAALLLCFAPTLLIFKMSFEYETRLRMRDAQLRLWDGESRRRGALVRSIEKIPGVAANPELRRRLLTAIGIADPHSTSAPLYYYGAATSRIKLFPIASPSPCTPGESVAAPSFARRLPKLMLAALELPSEDRLVGVDARRNSLAPTQNLWRWTESDGFLCLYSNADVLLARTRLPVFDPLKSQQDTVRASSGNDAQSRFVSGTSNLIPAWIGLISLLGAAVGVWMMALRRRLLLLEPPNPNENAAGILSDASNSHGTIWENCSEHEKNALIQICTHDFVSPGVAPIVRRLVHRGLVRRTIDLRLAVLSGEFCAFVRSKASLIHEETPPRVTRSRLPMYAIPILVTALVLFLSEEELTTRLIALLTTVTAGFETIRRQLASSGSGSDPGKDS